MAPMSDAPFSDTKDWTWVLERVCPECRFDVRTFDRNRIGAMVRQNTGEWALVLGRDHEWLRRRPDERTWSPLEYACHVRDVYELYDERLRLMLSEEGPDYPNWDQDATAIEKGYGSADPATVSAELRARGEDLAARFDAVTGNQWNRTGYRSDGAAFSVESFARYLIHDPVHHLWDVRPP